MTGAGQRRRWLPARVLLGGLGLVLIGIGGVELLGPVRSGQAPVPAVAGWLLAGPVLVDALLVPLVVLTGVLVHRVGGRWAGAVAMGLVLSLFIVLVAWPFVGGFGRVADNPSLLDRNYPLGLLVVLGLLWIVVLVGSVLRRYWGRRRSAGAVLVDHERLDE